MTSINTVSIEDIEALTALQLSQLLGKLLDLEAQYHQITAPDISVPLNITTADGGEDGHIIWEGQPPNTPWLPSNYVMFQNKATNLTPGECAEELLKTAKGGEPRQLKSRVAQVVAQNGVYVLFTTVAIVDSGKDDRIKGFRDGLRLAGAANAETFRIVVYDAHKITQWVNQHIGAVTFVKACSGRPRIGGFLTWDEWAKRPSMSRIAYEIDATLEEYKNQIESSILDENKIRIAGHSGLGKTRLVFESFRSSALKSAVVYYDHAGIADLKEIKEYFLNYHNTQKGIIIIDNCAANDHIILSDVITLPTKLKLITIGLDNNTSIEDPKIILDRKNQFGIVHQIINSQLKNTHFAEDIKYLEDICEGYPWMAVRFCENIRKIDIKDFSAVLPREFINRLLFYGEENNFEYNIIRACAVFSSFGFPDEEIVSVISKEQLQDLNRQIDYIRENIMDASISRDKFREICQKYRTLDIIERQGVNFVVKPSVLAINLAIDWLMITDKEKIKKILTDLKGEELGAKITERLMDLDQINKAGEIVKDLWGPDGFFASAEVLNTSWGSLLFRNVVEVNPKTTALSLQRTFGAFTKEQLMGIKEGRRNLIWALEKLVFPKETFSIAARILFQFAVAENENWSNNASNQFLQLFQAYMAGTEVDYNERLIILNWGFQKNDDDYNRLIILAIGRAIKFDHLTRMVGPEKLGSRPPLQDYRPADFEIIYEYWSSLLQIIKPMIIREDSLGELAKTQISRGIRTFVRYKQTDKIVNFVRDVHVKQSGFWKEVFDEFNKAIEYEKPSPEDVQKIEELLKSLQPQDIKNQLVSQVINPTWNRFEKGSDQRYLDKPRLNAESFAEYVNEHSIDLESYFEDLLSGQQIQTFNFGRKLGQIKPEKELFITKALDVLSKIPDKDQNPGLIAGFLAGAVDNDLFKKCIDRIIDDPSMDRLAFFITRSYSFKLNDVERLFKITERNPGLISLFNVFLYGQALDILSINELVSVTDKVASYGPDGKWIALSLLFMQAFAKEAKWEGLLAPIQKIVQGDNLLIADARTEVMEMFHWQESVIAILKRSEDPEFAKVISRQIVEYCAEPEYNYGYDSELFLVIQVLFDKYFPDVWSIFGQAFLEDAISYLNVRHLLWNDPIANSKSQWIFEDQKRSDIVFEWLIQTEEVSKRRIAGFLPIATNTDKGASWHPFTKKFIDYFGGTPKVLNEIGANMETFMSSGSTEPHYTTLQQLVSTLLDHPVIEVRDWAFRMNDYLGNMIKRSKLENEGGRLF